MRTTPWAALALGVLVAAGCVDPDEPPPEEETPTPPLPVYEGTFEIPDDAVVCADPVAGVDRFSEESQERGLTFDLPTDGRGDGGGPMFGIGLAGQAYVAQDVDADGDIDVVVVDTGPLVFLNDGAGYFTRAEPIQEGPGGSLLVLAAIDLDGDFLPELLGNHRPFSEDAETGILVWQNQGGGTWEGPERISSGQAGPGGDPSSLTFGDVDGDGDLDVHFVTRLAVPGTGGSWPERIFLNEGGGYDNDRYVDLIAYEEWGVESLVATFTDRDGDGDQDLYVAGGAPEWGIPPDLPGCAFFRNDGLDDDGLPIFVNDAADVGMEPFFSAMGIDSVDFNQDGRPDYCLSDVGPPQCFLSAGDNLWAEGGAAVLGLTVDDPVLEFPTTIGWSLDLRDIDNDGLPDVLQGSAPDNQRQGEGVDDWPDLLWHAQDDGTYEDVTAEANFGTDHRHVGMVTADFDGNGWIDVLFQAEFFDDIPRLYMNACGVEHWINLEFVGPPANTEAIGARVAITYGERTELREIYSLRATAQTPSRVHVGLGARETADEIIVTWPDGVQSRAEDVPANRLITVVHPGAEGR
ncbi:MAG: CRTAC1 family protein [Proteobacteria bacterium]|nr:CRTAC1 family protein [Pseudomonadota bacterium]